VVAPDRILAAPVDLFAPCATGGVLDDAAVDQLRAWAVCGAANNALASAGVARRLHDRGVEVVPDVIASAGAVIDGIGASVMGLDAAGRTALIAGLATTAAEVLADSRATDRTTTDVAHARARARLARM
jgi:leucine dehydrogenase